MIDLLNHPLYCITSDTVTSTHADQVSSMAQEGVKIIQVRSKKKFAREEVSRLGSAIKNAKRLGACVIVNDDPILCNATGADGVHLGKTDVCPTLARKHLYTWQMIGGTANTLQDCEALLDKQIDYISLGPLRATTTKANISPILGLKGYYAITDVLKTPIPIIAVGGITTDDVADLLKQEFLVLQFLK